MKTISLFWILPGCLLAKDFGVRGSVFPIQEESLLTHIESKLQRLSKAGGLEDMQRQMQEKAKARFMRPLPVEGLKKAIHYRAYSFDPTVSFEEDLKDENGQVFYKAGTRINPLETMAFTQTLLFFDGDDQQQVQWAFDESKKSRSKLILVNGNPFDLMKKWNTTVYFDQSGALTRKLGLKAVPVKITQQDLQLKIEEIPLKGEKQ